MAAWLLANFLPWPYLESAANFGWVQILLVQDWPKIYLFDTSQSLFDVHKSLF